MKHTLSVSIASIVLTVSLVGCNSGDSNSQRFVEPYVYSIPVQEGDGWQTASLQDVGIDNTLLIEAMDKIRQVEPGYELIDSILIVKDGLLVFDELTRTQLSNVDGDANNRNLRLHCLHSVTKSVNSLAIGIAIEQGFIPNTDIFVHDYFIDKIPIQNFTPEKQSVKLDDWLTMRHGYDWNERNVSYLDANNLHTQMLRSADPMQFLLDRPMATQPGTTFAYSTGVSYALGGLIERTTGQLLEDFMAQNIFQPLQINEIDYIKTDGQLDTGWGLFLTSRDMAKIGQLYLNGGVWNGNRIVAEAWIDDSTQMHVSGIDGGYGYQWWLSTFDHQGTTVNSYHANGFGGQYIIVVPDLELVVVFTGHAYTDEEQEARGQVRIVQDYILPSIL